MLIQLLPEQISKYWDELERAFLEALPDIAERNQKSMNNMLAFILAGGMQVWISVPRMEIDENALDIRSVLATKFVEDEVSRTFSLDIYALYNYKDMSFKEWREDLEALKKFARAHYCSRIIGRSSVPGLIAISKKMGANTDYTLISFDL